MKTLDLPRNCTSTMDEDAITATVVEVSLLLPAEQAEALETAARDQGVTTAALLRQLIREFCQQQTQLTHMRSLVERFRRCAALPSVEG